MDSIQLIEKIVQRLENRMDKQDTKIDKIMESVNVISTQRIYCVKECDARYVLKKMLEHDVKELFEKFAIKHVDWFNRIINTLKNMAFLAPIVVLIIYYLIYGK